MKAKEIIAIIQQTIKSERRKMHLFLLADNEKVFCTFPLCWIFHWRHMLEAWVGSITSQSFKYWLNDQGQIPLSISWKTVHKSSWCRAEVTGLDNEGFVCRYVWIFLPGILCLLYNLSWLMEPPWQVVAAAEECQAQPRGTGTPACCYVLPCSTPSLGQNKP